ncbi:conserved hypothetical protein [Thiomonas arsenitoxydans]|uniref:Uncharacterized protein n=1 Tax=Thiomonas arsenitoxydans (strain DSM 22701 / CIP 110005 / 3As) TaxID=426114 RepID=A0ABP1Z593_THIA3|nr:hypothetical protein [Thiomonas arsenitoxydans]CQR32645.1 conserved hypothetical protein [Thiomonas arsenitoxydans]
MKFQFRPESAHALAKELRRASWGVAGFGGVVYARTGEIGIVIVVPIFWALIQALAFISDNLVS